MSNDWKCVYSTTQAYKAYIIKDYLIDNEIEAVIINKQDSIYVTIGEVEVYTPQNDIIKAKFLIKKIDFE